MSEQKKILIIETAFIGDAVLSLALSEEIKRLQPEVTIDFLVRPEVALLLKYAPSVTNVHTFDKKGVDAGSSGIYKIADKLNAENYDLVICLHESMRTAKVLSLLRARVKIGALTAKNLLPYLSHSYSIPTVGRKTERMIEFARFFNDEINYSTLPKLVFERELVPQELKDRSNIVVIAPGSAWNTKKWSERGFIDVGRELVQAGNTVVVIGANEDAELGSRIVQNIGGESYNFAGVLDIIAASAVISVSSLVIGNDSAPIHIATACGVRSVEIMGPTVRDFGFIPPPELGIVVEQAGLWCRPCGSHGADACPVYEHECMHQITSEVVVNASLSQLHYAGN